MSLCQTFLNKSFVQSIHLDSCPSGNTHIVCTLFSCHLLPSESATDSEIHCLYTAVHIVHCPDDVYILRNIETGFEDIVILNHIVVLCLNGSLLASIVRLYGIEEFTEDLRKLSTVDFINYENERLLRNIIFLRERFSFNRSLVSFSYPAQQLL